MSRAQGKKTKLPNNVHIITAQCRCGGYFNPNDENDLIHAFKEDGTKCGRRGWITGTHGEK